LLVSELRLLLCTCAGCPRLSGSNVLLYLRRTYPSYRLVCLDKLDTCSSLRNLEALEGDPLFTFVQGDICDAALVRHLCITHAVDTVMNFAAQTHVDNSFGNSLHFTHANVQGTHTLLECVKSLGGQVRRFVHVSTDEVYGEQEEESVRCTEHSATLNPTNPYAASKAAGEFIVKSYRTSFQLPTIITRSNNVYGPRQFPEKLVPKFTNLLSRGQPCPLHGSGKNRRSFLHVEDVARAFDIILHRGAEGEIYNIGSEEEFENRDVLARLIRIFRQHYAHCLQADLPDSHYITHVRDRVFNDLRYHIDSEQVYALGWKPDRTDLDAGLKETVDWYLQNPKHWPNVENALAAHPYLPPTVLTHPIKSPVTLPDVASSDVEPSGAVSVPASVPVPVHSSHRLEQSHSSASAAASLMSSPPLESYDLSSKPWPVESALISDGAGAARLVVSQPVAGGASASSAASTSASPLVWLLFGHRAPLGQRLQSALRSLRPHDQLLLAAAPSYDEEAVEQELRLLRPDRVLFAEEDADSHAKEGAGEVQAVLFAPLCVSELSVRHGIHCTLLLRTNTSAVSDGAASAVTATATATAAANASSSLSPSPVTSSSSSSSFSSSSTPSVRCLSHRLLTLLSHRPVLVGRLPASSPSLALAAAPEEEAKAIQDILSKAAAAEN
jgi:UDP-glucose 4,6-dehydratase